MFDDKTFRRLAYVVDKRKKLAARLRDRRAELTADRIGASADAVRVLMARIEDVDAEIANLAAAPRW